VKKRDSAEEERRREGDGVWGLAVQGGWGTISTSVKQTEQVKAITTLTGFEGKGSVSKNQVKRRRCGYRRREGRDRTGIQALDILHVRGRGEAIRRKKKCFAVVGNGHATVLGGTQTK